GGKVWLRKNNARRREDPAGVAKVRPALGRRRGRPCPPGHWEEEPRRNSSRLIEGARPLETTPAGGRRFRRVPFGWPAVGRRGTPTLSVGTGEEVGPGESRQIAWRATLWISLRAIPRSSSSREERLA